MSYHFQVRLRSMPADTFTPVSVFLRLRDHFSNVLLLESTDYNGTKNNYSYICCQPVAGIELRQGTLVTHLPDGTQTATHPAPAETTEAISAFIQSFSFSAADKACCNGRFFGHINYDAVTCFETITFRDRGEDAGIPDIRLHLYRYVIVFDHFNHTVYLANYAESTSEETGFERMEALLRRPCTALYGFDTAGGEVADTTEEEYMAMVEHGKLHCRRGDVFQVVLSRSFAQPFKGDDFNVYRALRMINPSPYLFYFDYGNYRLFGSSPETQLRVEGDTAVMYPIAGTCRRTGNEEEDTARIRTLMDDPKENAEHTMLVDLARNDLAKSHDEVAVTSYKKIQSFSHVAHIVSEVTATKPLHHNALRLLGDTFPAGTLSGAPKYKAMQLIDRYEASRRGYYGGSIGFISPDGTMNQAIMIRTFLSRNHILHYRAGAGIVEASGAKEELGEVAHKLRALRLAIEKAKEIGAPPATITQQQTNLS